MGLETYALGNIPITPISALVLTHMGIVRRQLRAATREDHASIDRMLLPLDLRRPEDYQTFLNVHFGALSVLKAHWRAQDTTDFEQMIHCAQTDLAALGAAATGGTPTEESTNLAMGLGIGYVIRGSRRGAEILRRHVGAGLPSAYLDFMPDLPWESFLVQLESIADDPQATETAAHAARGGFSAFATEFARIGGGSIAADRNLDTTGQDSGHG